MRQKFLLGVILLLCPASIFAQAGFTTLSGVLTDSDSSAWASATWNATINTGVGNAPVNICGSTPFASGYNGTLDTTGAFIGTLPMTSCMSPPISTYTFKICPLASSPCQTFNNVTVTTNAWNAGSFFATRITAPRFDAQQVVHGYNTVEVNNPFTSVLFYNIAGNTCAQWNGALWIGCAGGNSIPGMSSDGNNGVDIQNQLQATTVVGSVMPQYRNILRGTYAKIAKTHTVPPAQLTVVTFGDSIAGNPWTSSGNGDDQNIANRLAYMIGMNGGSYFDAATPSAGVIIHDGTIAPVDYTTWMTGTFWEVPNGENLVFNVSGGYAIANLLSLFYIMEPGAGTFMVESNNGSGWTTEAATVNASNPTKIGAVWSVNKGAVNTYQIRITSTGGNVKIIGGGMVDTLDNSYIAAPIAVGGLSLDEANTTPPAVTNPILAFIKPDLVTYSMREQVNPPYPDGSTFLQEITRVRATFLTSNPLLDFLWFGASPQGLGHSDPDQVAQNTFLQQFARDNGDAYWDGYYPSQNYATEVALGLMDDPGGSGVHINPTGYLFFQNQIWNGLGFGSYLSGRQARNVYNSITSSNNFWIGYLNAITTTGPNGYAVCNPLSKPYLNGASCGPLWPSHLYGGNTTGANFWDVASTLEFWNYNHTTPGFCLTVGGGTGTCASGGVVLNTTAATLTALKSVGLAGNGATASIATTTNGDAVVTLNDISSRGAGYINMQNNGVAVWTAGTFLSGLGGTSWGLYDAANNRRPFVVAVGAAPDALNITSTGIKVGTNGTNVSTITTATTTIGVSFTSIAAQSCQEQTITNNPNVSTTNYGVFSSPRASLGNINLSWNSYVSATGTITIRVCNPTAAAITPASVVWSATVFQ